MVQLKALMSVHTLRTGVVSIPYGTITVTSHPLYWGWATLVT